MKGDDEDIVRIFDVLASANITANILKKSKVGAEVNHRFFKCHESQRVCEKSAALVNSWRRIVTAKQGSSSAAPVGSVDGIGDVPPATPLQKRMRMSEPLKVLGTMDTVVSTPQRLPTVMQPMSAEKLLQHTKSQGTAASRLNTKSVVSCKKTLSGSASKFGKAVTSTIPLSISAANVLARGGGPVPEIRRVVAGHKQLWQLLRSWAVETLKVPESKLPGGRKGGMTDLEAAGVAVAAANTSETASLPLGESLAALAKRMVVRNGCYLLSVKWPLEALPKGWGRPAPVEHKVFSNKCKECGETLVFRKVGRDDGMRTLIVCTECDAIRGCSAVKRHMCSR